MCGGEGGGERGGVVVVVFLTLCHTSVVLAVEITRVSVLPRAHMHLMKGDARHLGQKEPPGVCATRPRPDGKVPSPAPVYRASKTT